MGKDKTFKPADGVSKSGRLVLLSPLSAFWKGVLAREKKKGGEENSGNEKQDLAFLIRRPAAH